MAVYAGPEVSNSGLVLSYDVGNYKNSRTSVSTNIIVNGSFSGGTGIPGEADSNPTNEIVQVRNPGESPFVLRQTGSYAEYQLNYTTQLSANTTYVMSGWYAKTPDYNGGDTMFHARAYSSSGSHVSTGTDTGTLIRSTVIDGITWEYRYQTITTPSDYSNAFNWFVGYGAVNTTGYRYYTNLKLERGTFPSLVNMVSNTNHGTAINGPTYSSSNGGSLVFNGTNQYISVANSSAINPNTGSFTIIVWANSDPSNGGDGWDLWVAKRTNGNNGYYLGVNNPLGVKFMIGNDSNSRTDTGFISYTFNTWAMYTAILNRTANTQTIIKNNYEETSTATPSGGNYSNTGALSIGGDIGINAYYVNGRVPIVQMYNRALSATEVAQNFNALRGRYGI